MPLRTITLLLLAALAAGAGAEELLAPHSLNSSFSLSFGRVWLSDEDYRDFFDLDFLPSWTFRYDHRVWRGLLVGAGFSATGKSRLAEDVTLSDPEYSVRYTYTSFQYLWEAGLRLRLPQLGRLAPFAGFSALYSGVHTETTGYSVGYDAGWSDYRPASEIRQHCWGSRASLGFVTPVWANVGLMAEASLLRLEDYGEPGDTRPAVGDWNHSGMRLDMGLIQQF